VKWSQKDPTWLDKQVVKGDEIQQTMSQYPGIEVWMGEAGGAYNSGRHTVTDAFHSSFWCIPDTPSIFPPSHRLTTFRSNWSSFSEGFRILLCILPFFSSVCYSSASYPPVS
jgi:hypothetical protein